MGPAPMIRMVEISVLLGIKSHGQGTGHKKRARMPRVPRASARLVLARRWSLDQIPQPRKDFKGPINRHFGRLIVSMVPASRELGRPSKVIRHGLCPILKWAREAVNPAAASFLIISVSL